MLYVDLVAAIGERTQNNDPVFVASIPTFIRQAENRIYMEAKVPAIRTNSSGTLTIGSRSLTLPTNFIRIVALSLTSSSSTINLLSKSAQYLEEMYPLATTQATPKYWAHFDATTVLVAPTPDQAYAVNFHYFGLPTSIVDTSGGATWLATNFSPVLLYASLLEAYAFMKGATDVMEYYKLAYNSAMDELKATVAKMHIDDFR